jgi:sensor histidine kinase YesM
MTRKLKKIGAYLGVNFIIAVAIVFFLAPQDFMSWEEFRTVGDDVLYSFTLCITLGWGNERLNHWLNKYVSWIQHPTKRFVLNTVTLLTYSFLVSLLVAFIFIQIFFVDDPSGIPFGVYVEQTYIPMIIAVVLTVFLTSRGFLLSWRQAAIEAEKLKTERVASQYETLKNQVNPHFLFNSLNALTSLVYEDQDQAAKFIKRLADVYRYVLDNQQKEVVPLSEELQFLESYIFLQKMRFEDNLRVEIQVPSETEAMILPLSLQMLAENAIKHNIISDDQPLHLRISVEQDKFLRVENNLQPKRSYEYSSGLGLQNIRSRYAYLSGKEVEVQDGPQYFTVRLPLLTLQPA